MKKGAMIRQKLFADLFIFFFFYQIRLTEIIINAVLITYKSRNLKLRAKGSNKP